MCNVVSTRAYGARKLPPHRGPVTLLQVLRTMHMYKGGDVPMPLRQKPMFGRLPKLDSLQANFGVGNMGSGLAGCVLMLKTSILDICARMWTGCLRPSIMASMLVNMQRSVLHSGFAISCDIDSYTAAGATKIAKVVEG